MADIIQCPKCGAEINIADVMNKNVLEQVEKAKQQFQAEMQNDLEVKRKEIQKQAEASAKKQAEKAAHEKTESEISALRQKLTDEENAKAELSKKQAVETQKMATLLEDAKRAAEMAAKKEAEKLTLVQEEKNNLENKIEEAKKKAAKDAEEKSSLAMQDLKSQVEEKDEKLAKFRTEQLELLKKQRELEEKDKNIELQNMKRIDDERLKARNQVENEFKLRLEEDKKEKELLRQQVKEMQQRMDQKSQQLQGDALERVVESDLKEKFKFDEITPIKTGVRGADILQVVKDEKGRFCGKIVWETKRAKQWGGDWLQKVKNDGTRENADICVIVSDASPRVGFKDFERIEDVWVTNIACAESLAAVLRVMVLAVSNTKQVQEGKETKMSTLYNFLTSPEFENRMKNIVEAHVNLREALRKERNYMIKSYEEKEKQIDLVLDNVTGVVGSIKGISGLQINIGTAAELPKLPE